MFSSDFVSHDNVTIGSCFEMGDLLVKMLLELIRCIRCGISMLFWSYIEYYMVFVVFWS